MHAMVKAAGCAVLAAGCMVLFGKETARAAGSVSSPVMTSHEASVPEAGIPSATPRSRMPLVSGELFAPDGKLKGRRIKGTPGVSASSEAAPETASGDGAEAYGASKTPYTTVRVAVQALGPSSSAATTPVTSYPFRATGKLWSRWGSDWYVCTASLVKPSVLITAAHCVFEYGRKSAGWADEVLFYPAAYDYTSPVTTGGPYGYFTANRYWVPTPYYKGNDTCAQRGVVCNNDLATVVLAPNGSAQLAGNLVGWYSYGWNGYSFVRAPVLGNQRVAQITQLGYPAAFDSGYQMQRTDAVGWFLQDGNLKNTQIGSAQTGGSSGGPWLVNLGVKGAIDTSQASYGKQTAQAVIGVTSYGWVKKTYNRQGASFFGQNRQYPGKNYGGYGAGNIGSIMKDTCTTDPWAC